MSLIKHTMNKFAPFFFFFFSSTMINYYFICGTITDSHRESSTKSRKIKRRQSSFCLVMHSHPKCACNLCVEEYSRPSYLFIILFHCFVLFLFFMDPYLYIGYNGLNRREMIFPFIFNISASEIIK